MARIKMVKAREVLDSRGNPTVEAEIETSDGLFRAIVPSGASTGIHEAVELRDSGKRFDGKGVLRAVSNVNNMIAKKIIGMNVESQKDIDDYMIGLDNTENKEGLGANAILAVSMAACRAGAASKNIPLYRHIQQLSRTQNIVMPVPSMNIINGGAHAGNNLDIQEFMIMPTGARNFSHAIQIGVEVYHHLKKFILAEHGKNAINVGDEGGFAPPLRKISQAFHLIEQTLDELGYQKEVQLGVDCAASQYYRKFEYVVEGKQVEDFEFSIQNRRHHPGQKAAGHGQQQREVGIHPAGDGHRRDRSAKRQTAVDRQIGKIEDPKGQIDPDNHDAIDKALLYGTQCRIQCHPRTSLTRKPWWLSAGEQPVG